VGNDPGPRDDPIVGVTIVIVDDHAGFRAMARTMLQEAGFAVIGEAADGEAALAAGAVPSAPPGAARRPASRPRWLCLAQRLADAGGEELVVLTSSRSAADYGSRLVRSPARGFITKADLSGPVLARMVGAV